MRSTAAAILLLLALLMAPSALAGKCDVAVLVHATEEFNEWHGTGLTLPIFSRWLDALSPTNEINFMVKFSAISQLLSELDTPLLMIPSDQRLAWEIDAVPVATVGAIDLIPFDAVNRKEPMAYHWENLPENHPAWNFAPVMHWLQHESRLIYDEATIARAINSGLSERTPHDRLEAGMRTRASSSEPPSLGIGVRLQASEGRILIWKVFPDAPAYQHGLRAGDELVSIGDLKASPRMSVHGLRNAISQHAANGNVPLEISRNGEILSFNITPAPIIPDAEVFWHTKEVEGKLIGTLTIHTFDGVQIERAVATALDGLRRSKIEGLVLDLRDNPGGHLEVVQTIAGYFLGKRLPLIYRRDLRPHTDNETVPTRSAQRLNVPIITLVNGNSASAAEILSGVLQHYGASYLLGERTYGKATIQSEDIDSPEARVFRNLPVRLFTTRGIYYLPSGLSPQTFGLPVDFQVPSSDEPSPTGRRMGDFRTALQVSLGPMRLAPEARRDRLREWISANTFESSNPDRQEVVAEHLLVEWLRQLEKVPGSLAK